MLKLQFTAQQSASNPDLLLIEDVPVTGGWGTPNLSRANLSFVIFRLTTASGRRYATPPINWKSGVYKLFAHVFEAEPFAQPSSCGCGSTSLSGCGCHTNRPFAFEDGQYELSYEVWATTYVPAQSYSYHLRLDLDEGQEVWVEKNGVWTNITALGSYNDAGKWEWSLFDATDVYGRYSIRVYYPDPAHYRICSEGELDRVSGASPTQPTKTVTTPAIVAGVTKRVLLTQRMARRLAVLIKQLLLKNGCFHQPVTGTNGLDLLLALYTCQELLDDLLRSGENNSQAVGEAVTNITQRLTYVETVSGYLR